jgi:hypothetical protein
MRNPPQRISEQAMLGVIENAASYLAIAEADLADAIRNQQLAISTLKAARRFLHQYQSSSVAQARRQLALLSNEEEGG